MFSFFSNPGYITLVGVLFHCEEAEKWKKQCEVLLKRRQEKARAMIEYKGS